MAGFIASEKRFSENGINILFSDLLGSIQVLWIIIKVFDEKIYTNIFRKGSPLSKKMSVDLKCVTFSKLINPSRDTFVLRDLH